MFSVARAEPATTSIALAIVTSAPDLILVMPCGYRKRGGGRRASQDPLSSAWYPLTAVDRNGHLPWASSHFSWPGPRIVEGIAAMAEVFARVTPAVESKVVLTAPGGPRVRAGKQL
jgi:hypothetical protein